MAGRQSEGAPLLPLIAFFFSLFCPEARDSGRWRGVDCPLQPTLFAPDLVLILAEQRSP